MVVRLGLGVGQQLVQLRDVGGVVLVAVLLARQLLHRLVERLDVRVRLELDLLFAQLLQEHLLPVLQVHLLLVAQVLDVARLALRLQLLHQVLVPEHLLLLVQQLVAAVAGVDPALDLLQLRQHLTGL